MSIGLHQTFAQRLDVKQRGKNRQLVVPSLAAGGPLPWYNRHNG